MAKLICLPILLLILLFQPKTSFADSGIVINEITPTPSSGNDWIELYNSSNQDIDISNWILDDEGTSSDMLTIPQNTIIAPNLHKLFYVSNRLNKDGDTVYLKNGQVEMDKYQYASSETDVSFARFPDGEGSWAVCTPSPEAPNSNCQYPPSPSPEIATPSPSPQPSNSPSTSNQTTKPKTSSSPQAVKSPDSSNSPKAQVLGKKEQPEPQVLAQYETSPSPTPSNQGNENRPSNKMKIAALFAGSGLVTIGGAAGIYIWYHKKREKGNEYQQDQPLY